MGGFIVECDGEMVTMPFDSDWIVPTLEGRFPNRVMLIIDDDRFQRDFAKRALWTRGKGKYASISYCHSHSYGLTIQRHRTLAEVIKAKRMIDGGGCGGGCCKIHIIVKIDPANSRKARERDNIRAYLDARVRRATVRGETK